VLASQALGDIEGTELASGLDPLESDVGCSKTGESADAEEGGLHDGLRSEGCCVSKEYGKGLGIAIGQCLVRMNETGGCIGRLGLVW
jgi:hypothetical protein